MTWNCSYPKSVIERKIMSLFFPNKWGLLEEGRSHMLSKVRKKSGPKPRRNTRAGKVRRAPLPCFCRAFEPTTLVRMMVKHRDLRIEDKSNHHLSSFLVFTSLKRFLRPQGRPEYAGSHTHRVEVKFSMCCPVPHPPAEGWAGQKARTFQTTLAPSTANRMFPKTLFKLCSTHTPPAGSGLYFKKL